ncbi:unnamed protein product [Amoebophrya sp. A120]|nr:unnamed protein product [Amoebophrya sp. A120]|eukprot:GSA120T00025882001.1
MPPAESRAEEIGTASSSRPQFPGASSNNTAVLHGSAAQNSGSIFPGNEPQRSIFNANGHAFKWTRSDNEIDRGLISGSHDEMACGGSMFSDCEDCSIDEENSEGDVEPALRSVVRSAPDGASALAMNFQQRLLHAVRGLDQEQRLKPEELRTHLEHLVAIADSRELLVNDKPLWEGFVACQTREGAAAFLAKNNPFRISWRQLATMQGSAQDKGLQAGQSAAKRQRVNTPKAQGPANKQGAQSSQPKSIKTTAIAHGSAVGAAHRGNAKATHSKQVASGTNSTKKKNGKNEKTISSSGSLAQRVQQRKKNNSAVAISGADPPVAVTTTNKRPAETDLEDMDGPTGKVNELASGLLQKIRISMGYVISREYVAQIDRFEHLFAKTEQHDLADSSFQGTSAPLFLTNGNEEAFGIHRTKRIGDDIEALYSLYKIVLKAVTNQDLAECELYRAAFMVQPFLRFIRDEHYEPTLFVGDSRRCAICGQWRSKTEEINGYRVCPYAPGCGSCHFLAEKLRERTEARQVGRNPTSTKRGTQDLILETEVNVKPCRQVHVLIVTTKKRRNVRYVAKGYIVQESGRDTVVLSGKDARDGLLSSEQQKAGTKQAGPLSAAAPGDTKQCGEGKGASSSEKDTRTGSMKVQGDGAPQANPGNAPLAGLDGQGVFVDGKNQQKKRPIQVNEDEEAALLQHEAQMLHDLNKDDDSALVVALAYKQAHHRDRDGERVQGVTANERLASFRINGKLYTGLLMEHAGETIEKYVLNHQEDEFGFEKLAPILLAIGRAVKHVWKNGVVHNDFRQPNACYDEKDKVTIIDLEHSKRIVNITQTDDAAFFRRVFCGGAAPVLYSKALCTTAVPRALPYTKKSAQTIPVTFPYVSPSLCFAFSKLGTGGITVDLFHQDLYQFAIMLYNVTKGLWRDVSDASAGNACGRFCAALPHVSECLVGPSSGEQPLSPQEKCKQLLHRFQTDMQSVRDALCPLVAGALGEDAAEYLRTQVLVDPELAFIAQQPPALLVRPERLNDDRLAPLEVP